jgi:nucleotide-binding universal stress UspA family protein
MKATTLEPVVVGVTGKGENTGALRFAAEQAGREGREVVIAHAVHQVLPPPPPSVLLTYSSLELVGSQIATEVLEELHALSSAALTASGLARPGKPVDVLVDLSADARCLVLQHRALTRLRRVITGSTVAGVATHAHCPTVSVPAGWTTDRSPSYVTVGVHETGLPGSVVEMGFSEAAARGRALRVVHAWRLDGAYEDMVAGGIGDDLRAQAQIRLHEAVSKVHSRYPDVAVEIEVQYQWPIDALLELSEDSDLLVLGRHGGMTPMPHRLGSIAHTLIGQAKCPVMVVPVSA